MSERLPPMPGPLTPEERALAARLARLGPHGEPSPALDARILAAARAGAPAAAGSPRNQARWPLALGVAASVALAVGLAWQLRPSPEPVSYDEAASAAGVAASAPAAETQAVDAMAPPQPAPSAVAPPGPPRATGDDALQAFRRRAEPVRQAMAKPETGDADAESRRHAQRASPPAPPAPTVLQEPAPAAVASEAAAAADMALPAPPPAAPTAAPAKAAAPSPQAVARDAAARQSRNAAATSATESRAAQAAEDSYGDEPFVEDVPPATADSPAVRDAWLHRIRELQAGGDTDAARASLQEFVRRYPAFPLPDDLRPLLD